MMQVVVNLLFSVDVAFKTLMSGNSEFKSLSSQHRVARGSNAAQCSRNAGNFFCLIPLNAL